MSIVDPLELLPPFDFSGLSQTPSAEDGFERSSVQLYERMLSADWEYDVRVLTKARKVFSDGAVVPAGAELSLLSRSDDDFFTTASFNGATYTFALDELAYTY
jgi:hypothetical protein